MRAGRVAATGPDATETSGASVLQGGAWNSLALLLPQAYVLFISVSAARFLDPESMGRQSFISFVQLSLFLVFSNGMPAALTRFVGETLGRGRPEALRLLLRWSWRVQLAAAVVGAAVLIAVGLTRSTLAGAWMLAAVACAAAVVHSVPSSLLIGLQRWREATVVSLITGGLGAVAVVAALALGGGIVGIFVVEAVVATVNLAWMSALARRAMSSVPPPGPGPAPAWASSLRGNVVRYALVSTLQGVLYLVVWRRSEFFFLERYSSASEIAMYSIAFAATTAGARVPQGLATALLPAMATLWGAGEFARIRSGFSRALRLLLVVSLPMAAGGAGVGATVITLVYGTPYSRAGPVFVVLLAVFPLLPLYYLASSLLEAVGRIWLVLAANLGATVVNLGLNLLLVPPHGALGAAFANIAAQGTATALLLGVAWRVLGSVDWKPATTVRSLVPSAGAGAVGAAGAHLVGGIAGVALGVVGGAALFAVLAVLLRIVSPEDAAWLQEHAGHRLGGLVGRLCRPFLAPLASA